MTRKIKLYESLTFVKFDLFDIKEGRFYKRVGQKYFGYVRLLGFYLVRYVQWKQRVTERRVSLFLRNLCRNNFSDETLTTLILCSLNQSELPVWGGRPQTKTREG